MSSEQKILVETLQSLLMSQFEGVVFRLEGEFPHLAAEIPSYYAPLADRAAALVKKLSAVPDGLTTLRTAILEEAPSLKLIVVS